MTPETLIDIAEEHGLTITLHVARQWLTTGAVFQPHGATVKLPENPSAADVERFLDARRQALDRMPRRRKQARHEEAPDYQPGPVEIPVRGAPRPASAPRHAPARSNRPGFLRCRANTLDAATNKPMIASTASTTNGESQ